MRCEANPGLLGDDETSPLPQQDRWGKIPMLFHKAVPIFVAAMQLISLLPSSLLQKKTLHGIIMTAASPVRVCAAKRRKKRERESELLSALWKSE